MCSSRLLEASGMKGLWVNPHVNILFTDFPCMCTVYCSVPCSSFHPEHTWNAEAASTEEILLDFTPGQNAMWWYNEGLDFNPGKSPDNN